MIRCNGCQKSIRECSCDCFRERQEQERFNADKHPSVEPLETKTKGEEDED